MGFRTRVLIASLALLPLSIAAPRLGWGDTAVCLLSAGAILPLAVWLSTATEEIALSLGPTVGALLNAVFGNAAELIIALTALRAGLVEIVKASITGTVMANLLLALGLAMTAGGIGRREQRFAPVVARVNGSAMTLALVAIVLPSLAALSSGQSSGGDGIPGSASESFSLFVAWVLLAVYGLTLLFSLGTHRSLYDVAAVDLGCADGGNAADSSVAGSADDAARVGDHGDSTAGHDAPHSAGHGGTAKPPLLPWLAVLLGATAGLTVASEQFVGVIETVTKGLGLSAVFTGVVLLPLLSGFSEYVSAVSMARRNKMDLSVSVVLGATLLVALLVVPVLVLCGPLLGHPIDLRFDLYELIAIVTAVALSNLVSLDGRSDWLEGVLLLAAYVILAAGFFYAAAPQLP
ncbi:MAG: calcium:proton antiporter [Synechococcaceae cyanobacterium]|jgi:Ca2+:H+ antiporter